MILLLLSLNEILIYGASNVLLGPLSLGRMRISPAPLLALLSHEILVTSVGLSH